MRIDQKDIVVTARTTKARKSHVLICIEIDPERRDYAGMKSLIPETFVKFHGAPIR
jgi:hypothetical protein